MENCDELNLFRSVAWPTTELGSPGHYVSQFHIDGQPILPPLMTADKRREMQQLKEEAQQLAMKLDRSCKEALGNAAAQRVEVKQVESLSVLAATAADMQRSRHGRPQLQQTETFIFDSTVQQPQQQQRRRPDSLELGWDAAAGVIPTICVNPPTPQQTLLGSTPGTPSARGRKVNTITPKILLFESQGGRPATTPDKQRMQRSSTSPSLNHGEAGPDGQPRPERSRSFTLEEPSQALVEHMQRTAGQSPEPQSLPTARCYAHLRRDTIESRAKRVERSPSKSPPSPGRPCLRACASPTRRNQQQLEQLLDKALSECVAPDSEERAKRKMLNDIKWAHRQRFQQLLHYQQEEQRRMQDEFDRQQKFLLLEICVNINEPKLLAEYTSNDDLPLPERRLLAGLNMPNSNSSVASTPLTLPSLATTPRSLASVTAQSNGATKPPTSLARKRLFGTQKNCQIQPKANTPKAAQRRSLNQAHVQAHLGSPSPMPTPLPSPSPKKASPKSPVKAKTSPQQRNVAKARNKNGLSPARQTRLVNKK